MPKTGLNRILSLRFVLWSGGCLALVNNRLTHVAQVPVSLVKLAIFMRSEPHATVMIFGMTSTSLFSRTAISVGLIGSLLCAAPAIAADAPATIDLLAPISNTQWNTDTARHLLERAGFGGTPQEIAALARMTPRQAVQQLVRYQRTPDRFTPFDDSGAHDDGLEPFASSRPAATDLAKATGKSLGVNVKPTGNRRAQQVADRYLYWLRASRLETHRLGYWWANRMLQSPRPLQEKLTLFWHGHFATSEEKVRDYRKLYAQNNTLRKHANGKFRDLLIAVAKDPAMLAYLDAGVNVKGAPNENFAREIMELFTMGVGHYSENDIKEAARAFTGWNYDKLQFVVNPGLHDDSPKTVLGQTGRFDGVQVIDILLAQPATADFIAAKLYRYFVREDLSPAMNQALGQLLRSSQYDIAAFMETVLLSQDFYSPASMATRIKPPVELLISTYKKMELKSVPGIPDFNEQTDMLGQKLFYPPNVAGWAHGRSWITPGLLLARANVIYDTVFPPIDFVAPDRIPNGLYQIVPVADKLAQGMDVTTATLPEGKTMGDMSQSMQSDRDEDFNTRLASYHAWRKAIEKVKPIPRDTAQLDLSRMLRQAACRSSAQAVDHLLQRFLSVPVSAAARQQLIDLLTQDLGTDDLSHADSYMEDALRNLLHVILSMPTYQLG